MEKRSKIGWAGIATSIIGSSLAMTAGIFVDEIMDWLKENKLKSKGKEYYKEMLKAHPELKKADPKLVAKYWASLFHFAPHMAADPLSSGAFIRQSIDRGYPELYGGPPVDTYSTLTGIEKSISDTKETKGRFTEIAQSAAGSVIGDSLSDIAGYRDKGRSGPDKSLASLRAFRREYKVNRADDLKREREAMKNFNAVMKNIPSVQEKKKK